MSEVMKILPEDQKSYSVEYLQISLNYITGFVDWYNTVNDLNKQKTGKNYLGSAETQQLLKDEIESIKLTTAQLAEKKLQEEYEATRKETAAAMRVIDKERADAYKAEQDQMFKDTQALIDARHKEEAAAAAEAERAFHEDAQWSEGVTKVANKVKESYLGQTASLTSAGLKEKWAGLTDAERYQITKTEKGKDSKGGKQGTYGTALGNMQELLVQAYIEYMLDLIGVDELMKVLDRFPGSEIIGRFIDNLQCAHQGMFDPPIKSFLSTLSLDICGDFGIGIGFPEKIKDISGLFDSSFLVVIKKQFSSKLEAALSNVLKKIIMKVLESLDGALCKSLNMAGQLSADLLSGKTYGLDDAFNEAFCPDASEDDKKDTKNNLFKASGLAGSGVSDQSFDDLYKTLNATTSKKEVLSLLTNTPNNMDAGLLNKIASLVSTLNPEFAGVFGTSGKVAQVFGKIGNYISPELRNQLRNQIESQPDGPIYDSICLTQPELDKWNKDRENAYTKMGIDPDTARDLVASVNDKLGNDLGDMANILQKGTDGILSDALNSLLDPDRDPGCVVDETALVFEDESLRKQKVDAIRGLFENIERSFMNELINNRHAILNNILRDKNNFRLKKHERRADMPLIFPNYTNSPEDWEFRKENSNILVSGRMEEIPILNPDPKPLGNYPETVGGVMRDQLLPFVPTYKTSISGASQTPQVSFNFIDSGEETNYEFVLDYRLNHLNKPSRTIKVTETFHNRLKKKEAEKLGIDYSLFSRGGLPPIETLNLTIESEFNTAPYNNFIIMIINQLIPISPLFLNLC